jgi:hypothetical protein
MSPLEHGEVFVLDDGGEVDWLKRRLIFRHFLLKMEIMILLASVGWNSFEAFASKGYHFCINLCSWATLF